MMLLAGWLGLGAALGYGVIAAIRAQTESALHQVSTVDSQTEPAPERSIVDDDAELTHSQADQREQVENNQRESNKLEKGGAGTKTAGQVGSGSALDRASPGSASPDPASPDPASPDPASPDRTFTDDASVNDALSDRPGQDTLKTTDTLGGVHGFTTDLIGWSNWGTAEVSQNGDGSFTIRGSQFASEESLTISGILRVRSSSKLLFDGVIESQTKASGGIACVRVGEMNFEAPAGKKYWRLTENRNPCGNYTERIDIYFAGL